MTNNYPGSLESKSYNALACGIGGLVPVVCRLFELRVGAFCNGWRDDGFDPRIAFKLSSLGLTMDRWIGSEFSGTVRLTWSRELAIMLIPWSLFEPFVFNTDGLANDCEWLWPGGDTASVPIVLFNTERALFIPPKIRISSTFGGRSSILISTKTRHSGHLSSEWLDTIT